MYLTCLASLSGALSSSSQRFSRPGGDASHNYYYQAIKVTTCIDAIFIFTSSSSIDAYGHLYMNSFDPSNPSPDLVISNDDDAGIGQFQISINLQSETTYFLVVTTFRPDVTGNFSVSVTGPAAVNLIKITAIPSRSIGTSSRNGPPGPTFLCFFSTFYQTLYLSSVIEITKKVLWQKNYVDFNPNNIINHSNCLI